MSKRFGVDIVVAIVCALTLNVQAGEVKVNWQQPEKYTDIRAGNESQDYFTAHVIKELTLVLAELAKKIPDDMTWNVTITDLDLAGDVHPVARMGGHDIRIIKDLYWPRMSLHYIVTDPKGAVVAEGKDDISDMNFLAGAYLIPMTSDFRYEEKMLRTWFSRQQRDKKIPQR